MPVTPQSTGTLHVKLGSVDNSAVQLSGTANLAAALSFTSVDVGAQVLVFGGAAVKVISTVLSVTDATHAVLHHTASGDINPGTAILFRPYRCRTDTPITINNSLGVKDTASFTIQSLDGSFRPVRGQNVLIVDDVLGELFGGIIDSVKAMNVPGSPAVWSECQCVGLDYLLYKRTAGEVTGSGSPPNPNGGTFTGFTAGDIITYLVNHAAGADGLSTNVIAGPTVDSVAFDYSFTVGSAIESLLQLINSTGSDIYYSYVDAWRTVVFAKRSTAAAPWNISTSDGSDANVLIQVANTTDGAKLANRAYLNEGMYIADAIQQNFTGDGTRRTWDVTDNPIASEPSITLDVGAGPVDQTVGIDGQDTGKDYYWQVNSNTIRQDSSATVLVFGNTLAVTYQGFVTKILGPSIPTLQNNTSVDAQAAVEGGTGYYDTYLAVSTPSTLAGGTSLGSSLVDYYGGVPSKVEVQSYRGGLRPGQSITVNLPEIGASGTYMVFSVTLDCSGNLMLWSYELYAGALIGDWRQALKNLSGGSQTASGSVSASTGGPAGPPGPTAVAPPAVTAVSAPTITADSAGDVVLVFDITYPVTLGTMTAIYIGLQAPFSGGAGVDTSVNLPPAAVTRTFGPFALSIVAGVVQNTQAYIAFPAPTEIQTWSAEVATASNVLTNPFLGSGAGFVTFEVDPTAGLTPGAEWVPNPTGLALEIERRIVRGSDQEWRFIANWTNPPSDDPRFRLISKWAIGLFDPTIVGPDLQAQVRTLALLPMRSPLPRTPATTSYISDWFRVPDAPVSYRPMVRPVTADGQMNSYVVGVTCALEVQIAPVHTFPGNEYSDSVTGVAAVSGWEFTPTGGREFFVDVAWTNPPSTENRFSGVVINLVSTGAFALPPGQLATGKVVGESFRLTLSQKDGPKAAGTWSVLVFSVDANDAVNTYVAGVTPSASFAVTTYSIGRPTLRNHTFSVAATYTVAANDTDGKQALILTPTFTPPDQTVDPSWSYVDFWARNPADGAWRLYGHPDKSGVPITTNVLPSVTATWDFLLVDKDANDKDTAGNSTTDPASPPSGSTTYSLSIAPPSLGATGVEYASLVTSPAVGIGVTPVPQPDGTYRVLLSASAALPADTRFGGYRVIIKYTSGALSGTFADVVDVAYPRVSADVIWKPPAGSISAVFYLVSYNKRGQLNTILGGTTPQVSATVGSTSQLDFSATKLSSINQNLLRINPATGLLEIYNAEQAIYAVLQLGGGTLNGVCNTSGTAVVGTSGSSFNSGMVGLPFYVNGVGYTVLSYTDATHLTLSTSAGTQTGKNWSFGRSPQFKLFDRTNTQIGFWGDDSFNTGFTGLFAGANVRLGGTIGSPIFQVDSAGAVTINGAIFTLNNNGITTTLNNSSYLATFAGVQVQDNSSHDAAIVSPVLIAIEPISGTAAAELGMVNISGVKQGYLNLIDSAGYGVTADSRSLTLSDPSAVALFRVSSKGSLNGTVSKYNGATTVGMGVPPIYASVSLTGQTGSIGATNLQVGGAVAPAGFYRISWYGKCTTASGSDTLTVTITYNDGTAARTQAFAFLLSTTVGSGVQQISFVFQTDGATNIQYSTTRSGATGSPQYALSITLERLA